MVALVVEIAASRGTYKKIDLSTTHELIAILLFQSAAWSNLAVIVCTIIQKIVIDEKPGSLYNETICFAK